MALLDRLDLPDMVVLPSRPVMDIPLSLRVMEILPSARRALQCSLYVEYLISVRS